MNHVSHKTPQNALPCPALPYRLSLFPRLLGVAAHDLDFICRHGILIVQLEVDVLDQKGPHVIAKAVCIEMTLSYLTGQSRIFEAFHLVKGRVESLP